MSSVELELANRLRAARERLGQPQTAVARAIGTQPHVVNKAENGGSCMNVERLCQYALALGVEPGDLLPRLADLPTLVGLGGIETLSPVNFPRGADYVHAVVGGARAYVAEHGQRPRTDGGDARAYVGFNTTWCAIHNALADGSHGVAPVGGIHQLLDERGVGRRRRRA